MFDMLHTKRKRRKERKKKIRKDKETNKKLKAMNERMNE